MTVNEIISYIKGNLKDYDRSKGPFTDKYLWETFLIARAEVISNFRLRRFNYKNPQNYTTFCMKLQQAKSHTCDCITQGCDVLTTIKTLPKFFSGRNIGSLRVITLGNKTIDIINEEEYFNVYKYDNAYDDEILGSIINNKLIIWNALDLDAIQVRAFWEDITEIDGKQYCNSSTSANTCIDVYNHDIGVDKDLIGECMRRIKELLNLPLQLKEDTTNNSNSES